MHIIGRGGGAREDLWAFDDERVARALAACPIPTISAVGHEIDISICDLVADLRAATPSAAAEAAVPVQAEIRERLRASAALLTDLTADHVSRAKLRAADAARRVVSGAARRVDRRRLELQSAAVALNALSPLATLERGDAIVRTGDGKTVRTASTLAAGSAVDVVFRDGVASATIERVTPNVVDDSVTAGTTGEDR